ADAHPDGVEAEVDGGRSGPGDTAQHRVGGHRPERCGRPAAHRQGRTGGRDGVTGADDAVVVHAGERLVGEEAAAPVRRQAPGTGPAGGAPSSRTTGAGRTARTARGSRTSTPSPASWAAMVRRARPPRVGASRPPQTIRTARPAAASSAAVSMPVGPPPTTVT